MTITLTAGVYLETEHSSSNKGTIGCFAVADAGARTDGLVAGDVVLLTAGHVLFPQFQLLPSIGAYSPDHSTCCSSGDRVGTVVVDKARKSELQPTLYKGAFNGQHISVHGNISQVAQSSINCAIAKVGRDITVTNVWPDPAATPITGAITDDLVGIGRGPDWGSLPTTPQLAHTFLPGRGIVYGTMVQSISESRGEDPIHLLYPREITSGYEEGLGDVALVDQFIFLPRPPPIPGETFAQTLARPVPSLSNTDVGAVLVNSAGLAFAMLVKVLPRDTKPLSNLYMQFPEYAAAGQIGICSPIKWVFGHLGISIPSTPVPFSITTKARGPAVELSTVDAPLRAGMDRLRAGLRASRRGLVIIGKVNQHRREVRRLFATVRVIQASWRELHGAAFYHHCVENLRDPSHTIPVRINNVTRERLVDVIVPLLRQHASPALARDIDRYRAWALAMLLPIPALTDVPAVAARRWPGS